MVKKIIAIFLLLIFSGQTFSKGIVYTWFFIHQNTIAKTICEQKDVKDSCCKGSCYLTKKLKQDDKAKADHLPTSLKEIKEASEYIQQNLDISYPFVTKEIRTTFLYFNFYSSNLISGIFHPPIVA